jgi:serine/threonine protein kinase
VDGQTLEQMVSAGMIDLGAGIRILREVANIVGRVHAHGVAHRNLHASNVLVPAAGGPKLIGFGKCGFLAAPDAPATDSGGVRSDVRDLQQMLDRLCTTLGGPVPACLAGVRQPGSMETTDEFSEALAQWLENEEGNTNGD